MRSKNQPEIDQAEDIDVEERRQMRNRIKRTVRRRGRRGKWLTYIEEHEPDLHAELLELRSTNPMVFRMTLVRAAKRLRIWGPTNRTSPRDLPPLEMRRKEEGFEVK